MSEDPEYKLMETSSMDVEYYNTQVLYWYDVYQACMMMEIRIYEMPEKSVSESTSRFEIQSLSARQERDAEWKSVSESTSRCEIKKSVHESTSEYGNTKSVHDARSGYKIRKSVCESRSG